MLISHRCHQCSRIRVSFGTDKQLNYDITAIPQIWVNTYVNPAELGTNQSRISCLSFPCTQVRVDQAFCHKAGGQAGNLVPRVLSLPRESTLVTAGHVSANRLPARSEKNSASERVGVRASWLRERSKWDAGEPVDIVFNVPFRPMVISLLHICQGGNQTCQSWWVSQRWWMNRPLLWSAQQKNLFLTCK